MNRPSSNYILDKIEEKYKVDHFGSFRNNCPKIDCNYNDEQFYDIISDYKLILTLENSRSDVYITEKITHGFCANNISIYWGSENVGYYFNNDRFINVIDLTDETIDKMLNEIESILTNDNVFIKMRNEKIINNFRTIDDIAHDLKNLVCNKIYNVDHFFVISNEIYENERCKKIYNMLEELQVDKASVKFMLPTYKNTITESIYNNFVKHDYSLAHNRKLKKSELSLFLNYIYILEYIIANYNNGIFLIFESDVVIEKINIKTLPDFLNHTKNKEDEWDLIHIGKGGEHILYKSPYDCNKQLYRNEMFERINDKYIENKSLQYNDINCIRKFHTRCTDSFLWNYNGIVKFLKYFNKDRNIGLPLDHYFVKFFEETVDFKHYWTSKAFFYQGSQHKIYQSTIQNDIE